MAETPGDIGGGGFLSGTNTTICAISESDLQGTLNNFITRIQELEKAVSQLLATNIWANQLSDLSQQIGWVGNLTYLGVSGWSQTEYGSMVPPPGVTLSTLGIKMSDGNTYQGVIVNADGSITFGWQLDGTIIGSKAEQWDAGLDRDYAYFEDGAYISQQETRNVTITSNNYSAVNPSALIRFQVDNPGIYEVSGSAGWETTSAPGTAALKTFCKVYAGNGVAGVMTNKGYSITSDTAYIGDFFMGSGLSSVANGAGNFAEVGNTRKFLLDAGDYVTVEFSARQINGTFTGLEIEWVTASVLNVSTRA